MEHLRVRVDVSPTDRRWTEVEAWEWFRDQPWIVGCNFTPSTAINQIEFWQEESFDLETIDRELGWMSHLGMNAARVYLHDLVYATDGSGLVSRMDSFLESAYRHGIRTLFTLLDDCWHSGAAMGRQPEPRVGVHNSGWLQCPGHDVVNDLTRWDSVERYVKGVILPFATDQRVLGWDLYNEPGNGGQGQRSAALLNRCFEWARDSAPAQPLTTAAWGADAEMDDLACQLSDVVSFHYYEPLSGFGETFSRWKSYGRPMLCTEWLARKNQKVEEWLPWFRENQIGCFNWGFVSGKTQTIHAWDSQEGDPEPELWFHDLLRPDGSPFCRSEAAAFQAQREAASSVAGF